MSSAVSFGTNTNAQRKRVRWYNRESSAETLYEGQPVCYMFDTTTNILGVDTGASNAASATTTEGGQNEGKFSIVEKPFTDNLMSFAGVVAYGSWCGTSVAATSYKWIDIFIPNGAIVPVRCDIATTSGRTILALEDDSQALTQLYSANYTSRAVAIAMETDSSLTTAGITLAKLEPNLFINQDLSTGSALIIATTGSASCALNRINVTTAAAAGSEMCAFEIKMEATAGMNSPWGMAGYFRSKQSGDMTDHTCSVGIIMSMESGSSGVGTQISPLNVKLVGNTGATLSTVANLHVLNLVSDVDVTGPSRFSWIYIAGDGTVDPNFFIDVKSAGELSDTASTSEPTWSTSHRKVPVCFGGTTYYIHMTAD